MRVGPLHQQLGKRAHVEQRHALAAGAVLLGHPRMPVLVAPAVVDLRLGSAGCEEVGALPAHLGTEAGVRGGKMRVQRRATERPRAFQFAVGPGHLVVQAQHLGDAVGQPALVGVEAREAAHIDRPQVERGLALHDPLGQRLAGTAAGGDAHRVEAAADPEVGKARCRPEDEVVVGRERLGPVVELLDLRVGQRRHALDRVFHQDLERVPVVGQELELEVLGDAAAVRGTLQPGRGLGLEAAHQQAADFFLEIDVAVRIAQHRQVAVHAVDAVGDDVVVLAGEQRHRHADAACEVARPLAAAQHHHVGRDRSLGAVLGAPLQRLERAAGRGDFSAGRQYLHTLEDAHAAIARALGQRDRQVGRVGLAVAGQPDPALQVGGLHHRDAGAGLGRCDHIAGHAVGACHGGGALELHHAVGAAGHRQRAALLPAGTQTGFRLKPRVQIGRVADQPRHALVGAQLTDQSGRMPGGAAGQPALLEQHDVGEAQLRQVIGGRAAHDAAADDDDAGVRGRDVVPGEIRLHHDCSTSLATQAAGARPWAA